MDHITHPTLPPLLFTLYIHLKRTAKCASVTNVNPRRVRSAHVVQGAGTPRYSTGRKNRKLLPQAPGTQWSCNSVILDFMVAREGIEPPTRGFSGVSRGFQGFINQSLAASCRPLPRHTKAQSWHTQSELVTFVAQHFRTEERHLREG